jgi:hypothetical protein
LSTNRRSSQSRCLTTPSATSGKPNTLHIQSPNVPHKRGPLPSPRTGGSPNKARSSGSLPDSSQLHTIFLQSGACHVVDLGDHSTQQEYWVSFNSHVLLHVHSQGLGVNEMTFMTSRRPVFGRKLPCSQAHPFTFAQFSVRFCDSPAADKACRSASTLCTRLIDRLLPPPSPAPQRPEYGAVPHRAIQVSRPRCTGHGSLAGSRRREIAATGSLRATRLSVPQGRKGRADRHVIGSRRPPFP